MRDALMQRYLNVTLRSSDAQQFMFDLVTIKEKCRAEKTKGAEVNLRKDILASKYDGEMIKYCSLITTVKQLCHNHAIHLAVL